jgi:tRNA A-37 threonylcarbamoyl transferase component Bud32
MSKNIKSSTSIVTVNKDYVIKSLRPDALKRFRKFDLFENEVKWLLKMKDFDRVPNVMGYDYNKKEIKLQNVGEVINKNNIPDDWKEQTEYIISALAEYNCGHNDIKPSEVLVNNNKLYLVDFGWSTEINKVPDNFPKKLGGKFRKDDRSFDDRYSIYKSIQSVIKIKGS